MVRYDKREYKDIMAPFVKYMIEDDREGIFCRASYLILLRSRVLRRLGTSPTGMLVMGLMVAASITVTERAPELETYTRELSGVMAIQSGTALAAGRLAG